MSVGVETANRYEQDEVKAMLVEQTPLGRLGTPEDIAYAVAFLASKRASFITGQVLGAEGGFIV